jgi:hypothetical protein
MYRNILTNYLATKPIVSSNLSKHKLKAAVFLGGLFGERRTAGCQPVCLLTGRLAGRRRRTDTSETDIDL